MLQTTPYYMESTLKIVVFGSIMMPIEEREDQLGYAFNKQSNLLCSPLRKCIISPTLKKIPLTLF